MTIDHWRRDAERVEPNPVDIEVLIKEARRHQRRRYLAAALTIAVIGAAAALGAVLDRGGSAPRSHTSHASEVAAMATAKTRCLGEAKSIAGDVHATPHLYGAYPTTDRLAANWPVKIYPSSLSRELTTTTLGDERTANSNESGWPSFLPAGQRAYICIFTGKFSMLIPGMGGQSYIHHSTIILFTLMRFPFTPKRWSGSIAQTNSIPRVPVPVYY